MSNPLAEYVSALDARDTREQAHIMYINAYTRLADRNAARVPPPTPTVEPISSPNLSARILRPASPKGKGIGIVEASSPSALAQLRSELASTQRMRSELETKLSDLSIELSALRFTDSQQKKRIDQLEKAKSALEQRGKDRVDELKGKGRFVEEVQDEMVALTLQLNMAEQEKDKFKKENDELTRRWVQKMEEEARNMNDRMGWQEQIERRKGSRS